MSKWSRTKGKKRSANALLKLEADGLAGKWFRASDCCAAEGTYGIACSRKIEWAHIKSRSEACIRHSPFNALPLCWAHHQFFTHNPDYWTTFVERRYPGRWDWLNARIIEHKQSRKKIDYQYWIDWYKARSDSWMEWDRMGRVA